MNRYARVKQVDTRQAAINALAVRDDAAPYLRLELRAATDRFAKLDLTEALAAIEDRAYARNKVRFARWAAGRRFDLCNELIVTCPNKKDAVALIESVNPELLAVAASAADRLGFRFGAGPTWQLPSRFDRHFHQADESVAMERGRLVDLYLVRADRCTVEMGESIGSFIAVRTELIYANPKESLNEWIGSIILVNNSCSIQSSSSSMLICDGDLELKNTSLNQHSIVIANGTIQKPGISRIDHCVLCAAGDIRLPGARSVEDNSLYAGGMVAFGGKPPPSPQVRKRRPCLPFGVRFLDPQEFGLELAAQNGGVQVLGLTPESPFARHGLADGDIITAIDDVKADAVPVFRRALRRGVLRESVVLRVRRDGKDLTRIVFLDGVPLPPAPPPRPKP